MMANGTWGYTYLLNMSKSDRNILAFRKIDHTAFDLTVEPLFEN